VNKRLVLGLFIVLLLGVGGLVYWGQYSRRSTELYYSGTIEAIPSNLAFQVSGRVQEVLTDEGRAVAKGQVLAVLDRLEFAALRDQAQANLHRAEQNLRQLETGLEVNRKVLPAEVERAEAAVQALKAQLTQQETGNRSQDIARARLTAEATQVALDNARKDKARYDELFTKGVVAEKTRDAADLGFQTALKEHERAVQAYLLSKEGFRREEIDAARSRLAEGEAALRLTQSNLQKIQATEQEVEAARAQVASANAALSVAEIQLSRTELHAPFAGIVLSRSVEPGEVVSRVDLKVFVGETEIGKIKPGRPVDVKTDTYPDKTYTGHVAFISPQAEFTPKIIQTHKERVKLVYLVKVSIPNSDLELKSGMPADAWFR
jgi:HlyD family secretion protein